MTNLLKAKNAVVDSTNGWMPEFVIRAKDPLSFSQNVQSFNVRIQGNGTYAQQATDKKYYIQMVGGSNIVN